MRVAARRPIAMVVAAVAVAAVAAAALGVPSGGLGPDVARAQPVERVGVGADRVGGQDRFDTAMRLATATFDAAEMAIVTTGESYPDALAASYAAGAARAPVLLAGRDHLPEHTALTLQRLETQRVVLVGGPAALAPSLAQRLRRRGYDVERVAGADRYATAAAVARRWGGPDTVGALDGQRTALVASGAGFADALTAAPVAAGTPAPLLLTTPETSAATTAAADAMASLDIQRVVVVGGEGAVSPGVVRQLSGRGFDVVRWAGLGRLATSAAVAANAADELGLDAGPAVLARGDAFPDALTAGAHAGLRQAAMVLTAGPATLGAPAAEWLTQRCDAIDLVRAVGGHQALRSTVLNTAAETVEACRGGTGQFSETARASPGFPGLGRARLTDVRLGLGADHDRVEWHLDGDRPAWRVAWVDQPTRGQSTRPLDVDGQAFLSVTLSGHAFGAGGAYDGPRRFDVDGAGVTEVVLASDFEGSMRWIVGLTGRAPFAADIDLDPQRFVLDVAHP